MVVYQKICFVMKSFKKLVFWKENNDEKVVNFNVGSWLDLGDLW